MKVCAYCGHESLDDAARCGECGWAVPKLHRYAKAGRFFKRIAVVGMIGLLITHLGVLSRPGVTEGGLHEVWAFYSWRGFLFGMAAGAALLWLGDYLERTH